jgi:hypothetical protein
MAARLAALEGDLLDDATFYRRAGRALMSQAIADQRKVTEAKDVQIVFGITVDKLMALQRSREPSGAEEGRALVAELVDVARRQAGRRRG